MIAAALEPNRFLLIGVERQRVGKVCHPARHFTAIKTQNKLCPEPVLTMLVAQIACLLRPDRGRCGIRPYLG